jgi:DNA-binding NarL/FixJ family response regulator
LNNANCGSTRKNQVLIVDDHPVVRRGLAELISGEADMQVCAQAGTAQAALNAVQQQKPSIILLDMSLGDVNGISLIKDIRCRFGDIPILVLSMHDEALYAERALHAGARGYIMKEEATERIMEAIRKVLKDEVYVSSKMATRLFDKMLNNANGDATRPRSPVDCLSNRELEVFEMIGRGLRARDIAQKIGVSHKTVEAHRANIKRKLCISNAIELLQYATHWIQGADRP